MNTFKKPDEKSDAKPPEGGGVVEKAVERVNEIKDAAEAHGDERPPYSTKDNLEPAITQEDINTAKCLEAEPYMLDEFVEYSCHPIQRLMLGEFVFDNGLLRLTPEKAAEFDALIVTLPVSEQTKIKKLADEIARAEAMAKNYAQTTRVRGVDTSTSGQKNKA